MGVTEKLNDLSMRDYNPFFLCYIGIAAANFETLWKNFKDVAKLDDVVKRMQDLEQNADVDMINLKTFLMYETQPIAKFLRNSTEYLELYSFLKDGGLPLDSIYTWINEQLSWGNYTPPVRVTQAGANIRQETGLKALWNDLTSLASCHFLETTDEGVPIRLT